jgi:hypothetical protein
MKVHISSALPAVPSHLTLFLPCYPDPDQLNEHCPVSRRSLPDSQSSHVHCITEQSHLGRVQLFSHHRDRIEPASVV